IKKIIKTTPAIFSFGVPFTQLGFKSDIAPYILKLAQDRHYVFADDLEKIQANQNNEKRLLWNALKSVLA
ncbi:MAG: hypothetical protein ACRCVT_11645, partial [Leadbetterella sp.]